MMDIEIVEMYRKQIVELRKSNDGFNNEIKAYRAVCEFIAKEAQVLAPLQVQTLLEEIEKEEVRKGFIGIDRDVITEIKDGASHYVGSAAAITYGVPKDGSVEVNKIKVARSGRGFKEIVKQFEQ